jgi:hypothetical protein
MLLGQYLESDVSKSALARRLGISRYARSSLDRDGDLDFHRVPNAEIGEASPSGGPSEACRAGRGSRETPLQGMTFA